MVMDRINGFSNLSRELLNRFSGSESSRSKDEVAPDSPPAKGGPKAAPVDKAEISPRAHRLIALRNAMEQGRTALESLPDVRPDRVAEARARLDRGFYNSIEVRTRVAERLESVTEKMEDI